MPALVSASRRSDLPGFHAEELARRLSRLRSPPGAVFLWTKHPAALAGGGPLPARLRALPNVLAHVTITGLGGTALEPAAPGWAEALAAAERACRETLGGDGRRLLWRFDPVLPGLSSLERFRRLAGRFGRLGVRQVIASFLAVRSRKGSLRRQYGPFGLAPASLAEKLDWAGRLAEAAAREGLELRLCCQPEVVAGLGGRVRPAACIDASLAAELHPERRAFPVVRDPTQRRHCGCAPSRDLGDYGRDPCGTGCAYCYSRAGGPGVGPAAAHDS